MTTVQHSLVEITKIAKKVAVELLKHDKKNADSIALLNALTAFAYQEGCSAKVREIIISSYN